MTDVLALEDNVIHQVAQQIIANHGEDEHCDRLIYYAFADIGKSGVFVAAPNHYQAVAEPKHGGDDERGEVFIPGEIREPVEATTHKDDRDDKAQYWNSNKHHYPVIKTDLAICAPHIVKLYKKLTVGSG